MWCSSEPVTKRNKAEHVARCYGGGTVTERNTPPIRGCYVLRPADTLIRDKTGRSNFTLTSALVDLTTASETPAPMPMQIVGIGPGFPAINYEDEYMNENIIDCKQNVTVQLKDLDEPVRIDVERIRRDIEETVARHGFTEFQFTLMWVDGKHPFVDFNGLLDMAVS